MDMIRIHARMRPDRLAAHDLSSTQQWTYRQLDHLVGCLVAKLKQSGVTAGDRVAVHARNSVPQVALHCACARIGAIYVPLNWRLTAHELAQHLALTEPALRLADEQGQAAMGDPAWINLSDWVSESERLEPAPDLCADRDAPSLILFTSGTSGQPKGVPLSERNLYETAVNFAVLSRIDSNSRVLCEAPMFHTIGMVTNIRPVLMQGGSICVSDGFDAARTLARLSDLELGITHFVGVPQMMEGLRRQAGFTPDTLRHLVTLVSGGAPHDPADLQAWVEDGIPMALGYGMSEAGTIFGMPPDCGVIAGKIGSVGLAMPGIDLAILAPDGSHCSVGVAGELMLRGEGLFSGYWDNPSATAAAIGEGGWFATGDIVRQDQDGYYFVVDRKKDMFISGGENIYPAEIEAQLRNYPGLADCALVGVPDAQWGEVGHLAIVPQAGVSIDPATLHAHLASRLARYKLPKHLTTHDALPRTATGKLQKALLREMLTASITAPAE